MLGILEMSSIQRLKQDLRRLGAGDSVATNHEKGHACDAKFSSGRLVRANRVCESVALKHVSSLIFIETNLLGNLQENCVISHVPPLREVGQEQPLLQLTLTSRGRRVLEQAMGVEGLQSLSPLEGKIDSLCLAAFTHLLHEEARSLDGHPILGREAFSGARSRLFLETAVGVEFEGMPDDLDGLSKLGDGLLETPLPQKTPGTDDIGPNMNGKRHHPGLPLCSPLSRRFMSVLGQA